MTGPRKERKLPTFVPGSSRAELVEEIIRLRAARVAAEQALRDLLSEQFDFQTFPRVRMTQAELHALDVLAAVPEEGAYDRKINAESEH